MSLYGYFNTFLSPLFHAARPGMSAPASQSGTSAAAAPGAYSALSLAAITPVAGFGGRALRRAL